MTQICIFAKKSVYAKANNGRVGQAYNKTI